MMPRVLAVRPDVTLLEGRRACKLISSEGSRAAEPSPKERTSPTMRDSDVRRARAAAMRIAASLHLPVEDTVLLHNSNKLTLRLMPLGVVARVAPATDQVASLEVELAERLTASGCPVASPYPLVPPRPFEGDGFVVTFWTYYEPAAPSDVFSTDYAHALARLHEGMRLLDLSVPHFTDRVNEARQLLRSRERTPALPEADRILLEDTLRRLTRAIRGRGAAEQLLHGEPHSGNVLITAEGSRFIDFETCCRGPVEFDVAHAPNEVGRLYPGINQDLVQECRILVLAMITTWRWDRCDQLPDGRRAATAWLGELPALLHERQTDSADGPDRVR